jgi:hypothetical protein
VQALDWQFRDSVRAGFAKAAPGQGEDTDFDPAAFEEIQVSAGGV